jgi:riboflavin synthase, alpha subunit
MFSGIVSAIGIVKKIEFKEIYLIDIEIKKNIVDIFDDHSNPIKIGASICCSGVCLTVTDKKQSILSFNVSRETMNKSNLFNWKIGSIINLERSLKVGDEIGGHFVSGHVDDTLKVVNVKDDDGSKELTIELNENLAPFICSKGSITLEGISLTVNDVGENYFKVNIIPFTWENTNLKNLIQNDSLNVEIDMLARYLLNYKNKSRNK